MIIDAHHHLWNLSEVSYPWLEERGSARFFGDPSPIQQNYLTSDYREDWADIPVTGSVHVQVGAAPGHEVAETRWLDRQARETGIPNAIVASADITSKTLGDMLDQHEEESTLIRGIRQIVSRHPSEDTANEGAALLRDPAFQRGLHLLAERNLSFDLQLTPPLLELAAETFGAVPNLRVALCHAGSPWDQDPQSLEHWRAGLSCLARLPGVACKLSGLGMFNPRWTRESLVPIVEGVLQSFGVDRVMWGSNFPVDKLYRDYKSLFETVWAIVPENARFSVFGLNAARFYNL